MGLFASEVTVCAACALATATSLMWVFVLTLPCESLRILVLLGVEGFKSFRGRVELL